MGLKKFFRKVEQQVIRPVIQAAAPIAALMPGPGGAIASSLLGARQQRLIPDVGPISGGPFSGLPAALPVGLPAAIGGMAARLGGGSLMRAASGLVRTAAGAVRGVMTASGRFISSRKASQLAKRVGIDAAAVALGVSAVELAEMVLADQTRVRRGRGVSASDIKRTRRTIRTIERMHDQIVSACRPAMPRRPFSSARKAAQPCPPVRLLKVK